MLVTRWSPDQVIHEKAALNHRRQKLDLRYPPLLLRMAVVAGFFTGPGCLAGALLAVLIGHVFLFMCLGAIVGATAGAMMEWW
jgi:hypothetical protein